MKSGERVGGGELEYLTRDLNRYTLQGKSISISLDTRNQNNLIDISGKDLESTNLHPDLTPRKNADFVGCLAILNGWLISAVTY